MSKRKYDYRKLSNIKKRLVNYLWESEHSTDIPVDWAEFNQLYFSNRPVVVECPSGVWSIGTGLMAMTAGMSMAYDRRRVGFFASGDDGYTSSLADIYYDVLVNKKDKTLRVGRNTLFREFNKLDFAQADDWMFFMNFSHGFAEREDENYTKQFLEILDSTDGFKSGDFAKEIKPRFYGEITPPRKSATVLWDTSKGKELLDTIKEKYNRAFVFIEYGREKEFVDKWFKENETMLDPMFDIAIMDRSLDMRKVLLYAATNHLYQFREWGRFNPELLEKCFTKDDIRELM